MLKVLIIEDELITATDIKETLEKAGHTITAIARSFKEAMAAVKREVPDVVMIDINLENSSVDGIQTAKELLKQHQLPIIYLTASSENETFLRAKATLPAAYLLKPFRHQELAMQVELAYANRQNFVSTSESEYLFVPLNKGYEKIAQAEVLYLKAEGAYTRIYKVNDQEMWLVSMHMGYLAPYFSTAQFCKLSRSLMINLNYLERVERNQIWLKNHPIALPISDKNRTELMARLPVIRTP